MGWWICSECDYVIQKESPPETCPSCNKKCNFSYVTCFIPECGGQANPDVRLIAARARKTSRTDG